MNGLLLKKELEQFTLEADKILKHGGKINFNKKVINFHTFGNQIKILFQDSSQQKVNTEDIIISSIPITILSKFFNYNSKLQFRGGD